MDLLDHVESMNVLATQLITSSRFIRTPSSVGHTWAICRKWWNDTYITACSALHMELWSIHARYSRNVMWFKAKVLYQSNISHYIYAIGVCAICHVTGNHATHVYNSLASCDELQNTDSFSVGEQALLTTSKPFSSCESSSTFGLNEPELGLRNLCMYQRKDVAIMFAIQ